MSGLRGVLDVLRSMIFLMNLSESNEVPIVGLNWRDNHNDALAWLRDYGNPYAIIAEDVSGRVAIDWGVCGAPECFFGEFKWYYPSQASSGHWMMISGKETLGLLLTMRINQNNVFLVLFLCLIMNFTHAIDSGLAFSDPKLQQRYETLISEISGV